MDPLTEEWIEEAAQSMEAMQLMMGRYLRLFIGVTVLWVATIVFGAWVWTHPSTKPTMMSEGRSKWVCVTAYGNVPGVIEGGGMLHCPSNATGITKEED